MLEKQLDGWWKVSYQGSTGYVPAIFLELYNHEVDESREGATYAVATVEDAVKQTVAKQNRSKDDSDKPKQTHSHKRRGSDSGPTRSDTEPQFHSKVVFAGMASSQTKQTKPRKGSLSPPRTFSSTASKPAMTTRSTVSGSQSTSKVSSQPSRPQPPRPQRPPRPVKQSSHEGTYVIHLHSHHSPLNSVPSTHTPHHSNLSPLTPLTTHTPHHSTLSPPFTSLTTPHPPTAAIYSTITAPPPRKNSVKVCL